MEELIDSLAGQTIKAITLLPYYTDQPWPRQLRFETEEGQVAIFSVEGAVVRRVDGSGWYDANVPDAEQVV